MTVTAVGFGAGVAGSVILCPMTAIRPAARCVAPSAPAQCLPRLLQPRLPDGLIPLEQRAAGIDLVDVPWYGGCWTPTVRPRPGPGPQPGDGVAVDLEPDRGTDLAAGLQGTAVRELVWGSIPMLRRR